eukprot:2664647-Rhodomonas_salina.1
MREGGREREEVRCCFAKEGKEKRKVRRRGRSERRRGGRRVPCDAEELFAHEALLANIVIQPKLLLEAEGARREGGWEESGVRREHIFSSSIPRPGPQTQHSRTLRLAGSSCQRATSFAAAGGRNACSTSTCHTKREKTYVEKSSDPTGFFFYLSCTFSTVFGGLT